MILCLGNGSTFPPRYSTGQIVYVLHYPRNDQTPKKSFIDATNPLLEPLDLGSLVSWDH